MYIRTSRYSHAASARQTDRKKTPKPVAIEEGDLETHLMERKLTRFRRNWYERAARPPAHKNPDLSAKQLRLISDQFALMPVSCNIFGRRPGGFPAIVCFAVYGVLVREHWSNTGFGRDRSKPSFWPQAWRWAFLAGYKPVRGLAWTGYVVTFTSQTQTSPWQ